MSRDGQLPEPDIDEVRAQLEQTRHLRLVLDLLEETLPGQYASIGLLAELWALRAKFATVELTELGKIGQREYLVIRPLPRQFPSRWRPRPSRSFITSA